ncbi:helix-turn-helix transcriptional regulator [Candidatus Woesearchaeota archaeon]|nr:helix-turn-helix transcriptional regulator [Candidatus Woesearchaeota archaeon]
MMKRRPNCPRLYPLKVLSRKWSYLVLRSIGKGKHFAEIKKDLKYITSRILSRELTILQKEGMVDEQDRTYMLTHEGKTLLKAVEPMMAWSVKQCGMKSCHPLQKCSRCSGYKDAIDCMGRTKI